MSGNDQKKNDKGAHNNKELYRTFKIEQHNPTKSRGECRRYSVILILQLHIQKVFVYSIF
jgi:hypothetical protein